MNRRIQESIEQSIAAKQAILADGEFLALQFGNSFGI